MKERERGVGREGRRVPANGIHPLEALKSEGRRDTGEAVLSTQAWEVWAEPQTRLRDGIRRGPPQTPPALQGGEVALMAVPILVHELVQTLIFESRPEPLLTFH